MYRGLLLASLVVISAPAMAGKVAELFSDGVFGVPWGATIEEVKKNHPEGEIKTYIGINNYVVPHAKPVLNITRQDTDITFTFNASQQMHAVGISFEGNEYTDVYRALSTHFGKPQTNANDSAIRWPVDAGISMYLVAIPSGFSMKPTLTIEYTEPFIDKSKEELGFN